MTTPRVSIVIPSLDGNRDGNLPRLQLALSAQTLTAVEIIVVPGVAPQSRAINQGAQRARGEILVIFDDDSAVEDARLLEKLVAVLDTDSRIGMAGASVQTAPDANRFQLMARSQFPRYNVPVVSRVTDSDLACHGCVAIPKQLFFDVGAEREELVRGLDPDLRTRIRAAGRRVVLAPNCVVYHPFPPDIVSFARIFMRNGAGSAFTQVFHPEFLYDTDEKLESAGPVRRHSLAYRSVRFPLRIIWAVLTLRFLRAFGYSCYAVGYVTALYRLRKPENQSA